MTGLNFADSHNMVAYLEKSIENVDFAEIVDFLNANPIWYALKVSPTIYVSCIEQFWSIAKTKTVNNDIQIHAKVEGKTIVISESSVRRHLQFDDEDDMGEGSGQPTDPQHTSTSVQPFNEEPITVPSSSQPKNIHKPKKAKRATKISQSSGPIPLIADETVTKEREDRMERAATTAFGLEVEQDSGSGPRVNTLKSREDRLKLKELMDLYTKLSDRVLDLETTKIAQAKKIANLIKRVKNLERKRKSRPPRMNLFKIDRDFDEEFDANMDEAIEQVYDANKDTVEEGEVQVPTANMEVNTASASVTTVGVFVSTTEPITTVIVNITIVEPSTPSTTTTTTVIEDEDLTIAQTLMKMRSEKSKVRGVVMKEPSETATRPIVPPQQHDPKDKGKAQMQAELEEEERLARKREEDANIVE
ncbi:hypothetical protein Tco_0397750 [Tanacetum coccineum]